MPETKLTWTKDELAQIIREGGSVIHRGRVLMHPDHLPTEAELKAAHEGKDPIEDLSGHPFGTGPQEVARSVGDPTGDPNPISHGEEHVDPETGATISSAALAVLNAKAEEASGEAPKTKNKPSEKPPENPPTTPES